MTVSSGLQFYQRSLRALDDQQRLRTLAPRTGIDFSSNDYLALSTSPRLRQCLIEALTSGVPVGAGGSRLLRGNSDEHEALEAFAAAFFAADRALFFGGGYLANFSILSTLPQRGDLVLLDELSHASTREGARAGRAEFKMVRHNEPAAFDGAIRAWRQGGGRGRVWICVESLYSMDGDRAPLDSLMALADRHDALLYIDEAHATGVYGPDGRGLAAEYEGRDNVLVLHTCGKALGGSGAIVCGSRVLCDFLVNRGRPFIYATAPSPLMAVAALEALKIVKDEPERRERLAGLVQVAATAAARQGIVIRSQSQIMPIVVGSDAVALQLGVALRQRGYDVRAIRPPTVPEGTARLRIALTLHADEPAIKGLFDAVADELGRHAISARSMESSAP